LASGHRQQRSQLQGREGGNAVPPEASGNWAHSALWPQLQDLGEQLEGILTEGGGYVDEFDNVNRAFTALDRPNVGRGLTKSTG